MKKLLIIVLSIAVIGAILYFQKTKNVATRENVKTIGIIQIASHPALDDARQGFIDELSKQVGSHVNFVYQNAQGSIATAHMIAKKFAHDAHICAIYAIATPAAQAIATIEKEKPIFIAAVTDSSVLGNQENIYGVCDMIDMQQEIAMIKAFIPDIKTIGVVYNNSEANSMAQVQQMHKECAKQDISILEIGISQESDLSNAVNSTCRKVDALLCPTDNMIASAMDLLVSLVNKHNKPLFACHNQAVQQGALAARGVNYYECGQRVGQMADNLLFKHDIASVSIEQAPINKIYVNKSALSHLGLTIPAALQSEVVFVDNQ